MLLWLFLFIFFHDGNRELIFRRGAPKLESRRYFFAFFGCFYWFYVHRYFKAWTYYFKTYIFTLTITLLILAIGAFAKSGIVTKVGGGFGLLCGAIAFYTVVAEVIDGEQGYTFMPI